MQDNLSEIEELRKSWYRHVFSSLEKLDASVDKLSEDLHNVKDDFRKELNILREALRADTIISEDKLENRLNTYISNLNNRLDKLEQKEDHDNIKDLVRDLKDNINKIKAEVSNQVNTCEKDLKDSLNRLQKERMEALSNLEIEIRDNMLGPLKTRVTKIEVKLALLGFVFGGLGSLISSLVVAIVKHYFLKGS